MGLILLILIVVVLIGALPSWPYSNKWGYAPSGFIGLLLVILIILLLFKVVPFGMGGGITIINW